MSSLARATGIYKGIRANYWPLIKSLQTLLLLCTAIAGYLSFHQERIEIWEIICLAVSMFLAISGSTIFNMWYDRDIDAIMVRTCNRPLAAHRLTPYKAFLLGILMSTIGICGAMLLSPLYGSLIFTGWFVDVFIYTLWLKRRTCWSILWGGLSGGIPILAGRALAIGHIDGIGIALMLAILFWIPTHILTLSMKYQEDYMNAHVPTMSISYGVHLTQIVIALSSVLATVAMGLAAYWVGSTAGALHVLIILGVGLLILALTSVFRPSQKLNFGLFKYASIYMFGAMVLLVIR
jgi:heme o synthase